jgi:hypothetical protein
MKIKKGNFTVKPFFNGSNVKISFNNSSPGFVTLADFKPIARWDTVIGESVVDGATYRPGIVAYSPNGIEKVVFTCDSTEYTVTEMATNPDTGELEYFPEIDTSGLSSESQPIQVTAVVYDNNGEQVSFDQLPKPYGTISPFDSKNDRPGEVAHCFVCVASAPDVVYIAPWVENAATGDGSLENPYRANTEAGQPGLTSAVERIVASIEGQSTDTTISTPLEIRMLPGTYRGYDLQNNSWPYRSHAITARWKFVNTGNQSDVIIDRQVVLSSKAVLYEFENVTFDLSDALGNGVDGPSNLIFTGTTQLPSQVVLRTCKITSYKTDTVRINGNFVDNWVVPVESRMSDDSVGLQYIDCDIQDTYSPNLGWSRQCRIERAAADLTGGAFHLSLTAVDCSKVNHPRGYADDIHQDLWQSFNNGGTLANVILRNYNIIRFCGEGPFFSGNTALFSRVAMIDCDFGLTNREPGTGETGIEDGVAFVPDPARTDTSNPGSNGTGFAVDQIEFGTVDQYDNSQIKDDEQRLFLAPGSSQIVPPSSTPTITLQGRLEDFYIKGCTIFDRSLIKQRGYSDAFWPTALASVRCVFEDTFNQNGELFVPGSGSNNAYDDRQSFIALVNGTAAAGLSAVVSVPDLTTDNSEWIAEPTPETWNSNPYLSFWTSGFRYRVTTGLDPNTQYPT